MSLACEKLKPASTDDAGIADIYGEAVAAVRRILARLTGETPDGIDLAAWNDEPEQSADNVAQILRTAADTLDPTPSPTAAHA